MNVLTKVPGTLAIQDRWRGLPRLTREILKAVAIAAGIAFLVYLPFLQVLPFAQVRTDLSSRGSSWDAVLFQIVVYMIVAVGLNVVIGLAGLLDLGYIGFYAVGAYSVAIFGSPSSPVTQWMVREFGFSEGWAVPFVACIPIAMAFALMAGLILGAPTLRLRGDYLAIVTMGFGEIIRIVLRNVRDVSGGPQGIVEIPSPPGPQVVNDYGVQVDLFNRLDHHYWYWLALAVLILLIILVRRLENSRVGRAWLAIREDEDAAAIMGVPALKYKLWAFVIGAMLGAIAGMLFASHQTAITPNDFQLNLSFLFVAMVVIGGSGNMVGAMLGAFLITYLPERFRDFQEWRPFAFGLALVLVMIFRPQGLIPSRRRAAEFRDRQIEAEEAATDA